jgi:hypothetical protein
MPLKNSWNAPFRTSVVWVFCSIESAKLRKEHNQNSGTYLRVAAAILAGKKRRKMLVLVGFALPFSGSCWSLEPPAPAPAPATATASHERTRHAVSKHKKKQQNNARTLACNTRTCSWTHVACLRVQISRLRMGRNKQPGRTRTARTSGPTTEE